MVWGDVTVPADHAINYRVVSWDCGVTPDQTINDDEQFREYVFYVYFKFQINMTFYVVFEMVYQKVVKVVSKSLGCLRNKTITVYH